jgi:hypothetical protein
MGPVISKNIENYVAGSSAPPPLITSGLYSSTSVSTLAGGPRAISTIDFGSEFSEVTINNDYIINTVIIFQDSVWSLFINGRQLNPTNTNLVVDIDYYGSDSRNVDTLNIINFTSYGRSWQMKAFIDLFSIPLQFTDNISITSFGTVHKLILDNSSTNIILRMNAVGYKNYEIESQGSVQIFSTNDGGYSYTSDITYTTQVLRFTDFGDHTYFSYCDFSGGYIKRTDANDAWIFKFPDIKIGMCVDNISSDYFFYQFSQIVLVDSASAAATITITSSVTDL